MPPVVRRRTAPRSDGYGAARPDVTQHARDDDEHPGGPGEFTPRAQRGSGNGRRARTTAASARGWAAYKKIAERSKRGFGSPDEFRVAEIDVQYLIKVLDEAPMWSYGEHYVKEVQEGSKVLGCGGEICPLCDCPQVRLTAYAVWDIALWVPDEKSPDGGSWVHKFWRATPDPAGKLMAIAEMLASSRNPRTLDDEYLMISKTDSNKKAADGRSFNEFSAALVKERDLEDDYGAYPVQDADYDDFADHPFDPEKLFPATPMRDLRKAAEALDDPAAGNPPF